MSMSTFKHWPSQWWLLALGWTSTYAWCRQRLCYSTVLIYCSCTTRSPDSCNNNILLTNISNNGYILYDNFLNSTIMNINKTISKHIPSIFVLYRISKYLIKYRYTYLHYKQMHGECDLLKNLQMGQGRVSVWS